MAILKYRSDSDREFLVALGTTIKPGADFLVGISLNFPDAFGIGVFAVRTYRAFRPKNRSQCIRGRFRRWQTVFIWSSVRSFGVGKKFVFMPQISPKLPLLSSGYTIFIEFDYQCVT